MKRLRTGSALLLLIAAPLSAEPMIVDHGRLFIRGEVDKVSTEALLDSGAESTIIDPILAAKAGITGGTATDVKGSGGAAPARVVTGVTIKALGVTLTDREIAVLNLSDVSTRLIKRPTMAIFGRELFDAARLRIDIERGAIEALSANSMPAGQRLALTAHAGIESAPVKVNGISAAADFDLGNGGDVLVSAAFAKRLRLKLLGAKAGGGIGGSIQRQKVRLASLTIAGRTFRNVPAQVDPLANAGEVNIGTSILRQFVVTTDFGGHAIYLAPHKGH